jgi:uncharacterized membrane protein YozB (DUF420 family)
MTTVPEIVGLGVVSLVVALMVWSIPGGGMMVRLVAFCLLAVNLIVNAVRGRVVMAGLFE